MGKHETRKTVLAPCHAGTGLRQEYETAYPPDRSGSFPSNPLLFIVGKLLFSIISMMPHVLAEAMITSIDHSKFSTFSA